MHCLSISRSYEFVMTEMSTPWDAQLFNTDALHRAVAVLYNCSPRWLLMDDVLDELPPPNRDIRSKPVLSMLKSNRPDKSKFRPPVVAVDDTEPDFTSTIKSRILSKSFLRRVLSWVDCICNSASVWVNRLSIWSDDRPIY